MEKKYLMAIDSGTQSTRVSIFDTDGNRICIGSSIHPPMIREDSVTAEHGSEDIWNGVLEASKKAFEKFEGDKSDIIGVGIASQRGAVMAIDKEGKVIQRPISWMDNRWLIHAAELGAYEGELDDPFYTIFQRYYSRANLIKTIKPDIYEKTYKFLSPTGIITYRLTGKACDAIANNVGWPIDRINFKMEEDENYYKAMGLTRETMAEFFRPGEIMSYVSEEGEKLSGIPAGVPIIAAASDKQSELLGANVIKPGQAYITLGTLSGLDIVGTELRNDAEFQCYLSPIIGQYNYESFVSNGFWLVSWFKDNFGMDLSERAKESGLSIEDLLNEEGKDISAGSEGIVVIPDWQAPQNRPNSKGMFLGFDSRHTRGHMFTALLESIVMHIKIDSDRMSALAGVDIKELTIGGGGSRSELVGRIIADVFGIPVYRVEEPETTSLGVAICVAVGAGVYDSIEDAIKIMVKPPTYFEPTPKNHEVYNKLVKNVIIPIYPQLEGILKQITEITTPEQPII